MKNLFVVFLVLAVALSGVRCTTDERPVPEESKVTGAKPAQTSDEMRASSSGSEQLAEIEIQETSVNSNVVNQAVSAGERNANQDIPNIVTITINGGFGRASCNCCGFGICWVSVFGECLYGPCSHIPVALIGNESYLRFYIPEGLGFTVSDPFYVDDADVIGSEVAAVLGYTSIVLQTGSYTAVPVPGSTNAGYVDVPISSIQ
jgi:hypothetical protein